MFSVRSRACVRVDAQVLGGPRRGILSPRAGVRRGRFPPTAGAPSRPPAGACAGRLASCAGCRWLTSWKKSGRRCRHCALPLVRRRCGRWRARSPSSTACSTWVRTLVAFGTASLCSCLLSVRGRLCSIPRCFGLSCAAPQLDLSSRGGSLVRVRVRVGCFLGGAPW